MYCSTMRGFLATISYVVNMLFDVPHTSSLYGLTVWVLCYNGVVRTGAMFLCMPLDQTHDYTYVALHHFISLLHTLRRLILSTLVR